MILMWQQDGETLKLMHGTFPGRVLSRFGDQNWPPRSCDLTPLDFFLWGYLKPQVYYNKPETTRALKEEIQCCINEIQPLLCRIVMEIFDKRMRMYMESRGDHLPDVLFHK